ncbi:MAG: hypothetical protein QOI61_1573 [Actinomycetota bacterium]|jgi:hypothetical protein
MAREGGRRRDKSLEERRRLRREATVEAAVARGAGLDVRDQIEMARNASVWGVVVAGIAAAGLAPTAIVHPSSVWGLFEAFAAAPALVLARRAWMMQRSLRGLDDTDDAAVTEGDDEMAHLREIVRSLDSRPAKKVGRTALAAADRGFAERRNVLIRRGHVEALLADADPNLGNDALAADLESCDRELADVDHQLAELISAVAHLAASSDQSRGRAVANVRDASDAVKALALGFDELNSQE